MLASPAGYIAETTGWVWFFIICAAAAIPGLLILWLLTRRGAFAEIEHKEKLAEAASG
jgi:PAT family beta-lactamase induction signal transducer AmpG